MKIEPCFFCGGGNVRPDYDLQYREQAMKCYDCGARGTETSESIARWNSRWHQHPPPAN